MKADTSPPANTSSSPRAQSVFETPISKVTGTTERAALDTLAVEEPLEIRLAYHHDGKPVQQSISITMRTPGDDFELAAGFLFTEGIVRAADDVANVRHCGPPVGELELRNTVRVELQPTVAVDVGRLQRHFYTSSSCGVCGKTSLAALEVTGLCVAAMEGVCVDAELIHRLPSELRRAQQVFNRTGGLHAAALFDTAGQLLALREDVGRHNAVDKLIGSQLLAGRMPLHEQMLLVSGRASFELVQKAVVAGIPIMAAVGAPSSLAVELAQRYGMTLLGFVRDERFNVYCGGQRLTGLAGSE
jgi:FdhD protein